MQHTPSPCCVWYMLSSLPEQGLLWRAFPSGVRNKRSRVFGLRWISHEELDVKILATTCNWLRHAKRNTTRSNNPRYRSTRSDSGANARHTHSGCSQKSPCHQSKEGAPPAPQIKVKGQHPSKPIINSVQVQGVFSSSFVRFIVLLASGIGSTIGETVVYKCGKSMYSLLNQRSGQIIHSAEWGTYCT